MILAFEISGIGDDEGPFEGLPEIRGHELLQLFPVPEVSRSLLVVGVRVVGGYVEVP